MPRERVLYAAVLGLLALSIAVFAVLTEIYR
jgi:hypothetical protein